MSRQLKAKITLSSFKVTLLRHTGRERMGGQRKVEVDGRGQVQR
jgi:hypothetical protein